MGGVAQVILGMAKGLSALSGGDRYIFMVNTPDAEWLRAYIGGGCELRVIPEEKWARRREGLRRFIEPRGLNAILRGWDDLCRRLPMSVPHSDGAAEQCGAEIVHFLHQWAFLTNIPSVYHPHDLQHIHLPEFFSPRERQRRTFLYKAFCEQAQMVAVTSSWTARDIHTALGIPDEKIVVIPFAPPSKAYQPLARDILEKTRIRIGFEQFILYPAQTWAHKNHINLLRALRSLRDRGVTVPLVCPGFQNSFFPQILAEVSRLNIADQVVFTGFVGDHEVHALYSLCAFVVVPTRFEAVSGPVWDAFAAGKTVTASNVTSLPEQIGDAGLLFDPDDVEGMSECIRRLWADADLRSLLAGRATRRIENLSWENTALRFRAHYRRILRLSLTPQDRSMLYESPVI